MSLIYLDIAVNFGPITTDVISKSVELLRQAAQPKSMAAATIPSPPLPPYSMRLNICSIVSLGETAVSFRFVGCHNVGNNFVVHFFCYFSVPHNYSVSPSPSLAPSLSPPLSKSLFDSVRLFDTRVRMLVLGAGAIQSAARLKRFARSLHSSS